MGSLFSSEADTNESLTFYENYWKENPSRDSANAYLAVKFGVTIDFDKDPHGIIYPEGATRMDDIPVFQELIDEIETTLKKQKLVSTDVALPDSQ